MVQRPSSSSASRLPEDLLDASPSGASAATEAQYAEMCAELARLKTLDLAGLRIRYRQLTRKTVPEAVPRWLLLRLVAYRLQERAFGGLDAVTRKALDDVARALAADESARKHGARRPVVPRVPGIPSRRFRSGTVLVREHAGILHHVTVTDDGFSWNGGAYRSLSEVARAITGTVWNGPAFFGLKEKAGRRHGVSANKSAGDDGALAGGSRGRGRGSAPKGEHGAEGGAA